MPSSLQSFRSSHVPQPTLGSLLPGWKQSTVLLVVEDGSDGVHAGLEFLCRCAEIIMNPIDSTITGTLKLVILYR